jgi:hypothetical protein
VAVVEAVHDPLLRFAEHRKHSDAVGRAPSRGFRCLEPEWRNAKVAQRQQRQGPAWRSSQHLLGRMPCIERSVVGRDAIGVDELRAGEQCVCFDIGFDRVDVHLCPSVLREPQQIG